MKETWHILGRHESEQSGAISAAAGCGGHVCPISGKDGTRGPGASSQEMLNSGPGEGPVHILIDFCVSKHLFFKHIWAIYCLPGAASPSVVVVHASGSSLRRARSGVPPRLPSQTEAKRESAFPGPRFGGSVNPAPSPSTSRLGMTHLYVVHLLHSGMLCFCSSS